MQLQVIHYKLSLIAHLKPLVVNPKRLAVLRCVLVWQHRLTAEALHSFTASGWLLWANIVTAFRPRSKLQPIRGKNNANKIEVFHLENSSKMLFFESFYVLFYVHSMLFLK